MTDSERVLVWAPNGRDAVLASDLLTRHGLDARVCTGIEDLVSQLADAGCAVIASEALDAAAQRRFQEALADQPAWSDFPVILFAPPGASRTSDAREATAMLGNVTLLERPVRSRTLISAVTAALRARRRQFEGREAIRRRDQFLAMLGHELRNPLAAIVLAIESLETVSSEVGGKQRRIIDRQARHLARLVDDLLDVSRVTSGKVTLKAERVDLGEIVTRCIQGAELAAKQRGIRLRSTIHDTPLPVHGDLVRLEEVLNNLIGNALKYSPDGARVDVNAFREGTQCVVDVIDTGIGIEANMLESVFDLFSQVEGSIDRAKGGLGIGLTLARSLVELHGGTIEVASKGLGSGSRFRVRLPELVAASRTTGRATGPNLALVPDHQGIRIVVVEDNVDLLEITKDLLEALGHQVWTAPDGLRGVATILLEQPDLALVDIGLPGLDGYNVARKIRQQLDPAPYLVAMTGYGQGVDRQRALDAGFDDHLTKPITPETLARAIAASPAASPSRESRRSRS